MEKNKTPLNPLIDQHPVDTLIHIQSVLSFIQEYTARATEEPGITPYEARINTGLFTILKTVNDALHYEIERLENQQSLTMVN